MRLKATKFVVDNIPIFVDPFGNIVDVDFGQAGGGDVLQAQNGSLVYYTILTNDVYAYFLTGVDAKKIDTNNQFPTKNSDLQQVIRYAKSRGVTFPDPDALTVEIKASWVEAKGLANLDTYLTVEATVPTYDTSNPKKWTVISGKDRTIKLALVGMHVVGSVAGHPEMVWATFEHVANDPRGKYQYINTSDATVTVPQQTGGPWTFAATNASTGFNVPHEKVCDDAKDNCVVGSDIVARTHYQISPSDTIHWKPFGSSYDVPPNPEDGSPTASNTEILSINNSVRSQLIRNDIRRNYIFSGATWTKDGTPPVYKDTSNQLGTSLLANSTLETYHQGSSIMGGSSTDSNCFTCHTNVTATGASCGSLTKTCVSHVYSSTKPLP